MASTQVKEFLSAAEIDARVKALAGEIRRAAGPDTPVHLVGVLKGAFVMMADIARAISVPAEFDFMAVSSYGSSTKTSGIVRILKDLDLGS